MADIIHYIRRVTLFIAAILSYIPALIYEYIFARFFTLSTYRLIGQRNQKRPQVKNVLDIGTATGHALHSIIDNFSNAQVLGIDYNNLYVPKCKKLFERYDNVEIKQMDYYTLETQEPETQFDVIIFGSSFMIMPDQTKALEIAKRKLNKNGRIYFLLTLYQNKHWWNTLMERVKPALKYITTIDFGKVTYRNEFQSFIIGHGLNITLNERCVGNPFLNYFTFYIIEATKTIEQTF